MERIEPLDISYTGSGERTDLAGIRTYMAHHFHEPLSIEQLAGMAGLKPKYFSGHVYNVDDRCWLGGGVVAYSNVIDDVLEIIVP
ncbi:hypothetical protein D3C81_1375200 [compost metagenome]